MIRLSTRREAPVTLNAFLCFAFVTLNRCLGQSVNEDTKVLPLSTAYVPAGGVAIGKPFPITVEWNGQEYHALEGMSILMKIIEDPATTPFIRTKALDHLGRIPSRDSSSQLLALFDDLREPDEKVGVMRCLISSEDPRGLPLFGRVLDKEHDNRVRSVAAYGLARWNVRRGVAELIDLLDSKDVVPQEEHSPYICENAVLDVFLNENRRKGWSFSADRIADEIPSAADVSDARICTIYIMEIKKWFAEHEHQFPDWKTGDPLPSAPNLPPIPPGPKSALPLSAQFRPPPLVTVVPGEEERQVYWKGKPYSVQEGVELLINVALDKGIANDRFQGDRFEAIERLGELGEQLRGTERIPDLIELYRRLTDRSEKVSLLFCIAQSTDPRVLPFLAGILDTNAEAYLRLPAAYGLALWNVRSGVRELIELLLMKQGEEPIRYPGVICDKAAQLLSRLNFWKSWSAPERPLQAIAEARTEVHDKVVHSSHVELKKWFTESEHRFPDWKFGDPLPKAPEPDKEQHGDHGRRDE